MVLLLKWLEEDKKINDNINSKSGLLSLVAIQMHGETR
jgi:hypothetical protein